jgi:hypothetical protein
MEQYYVDTRESFTKPLADKLASPLCVQVICGRDQLAGPKEKACAAPVAVGNCAKCRLMVRTRL